VFPLGTDGKTAPGAGLEIYPNPASHETTVVARFAYPVSGRVDLVNAAGEVIRSQEFEQTRELLKTFNLDGLPGSIYLFVVKTADYTLTKTLVKN
jgi:hypothetical protein